MNAQPRIAVIAGDGVGPEVVEAELFVLDATGVKFTYSHHLAGDACLESTGTTLPEATLQAALDADAVIFGAVGRSAAEVILPLRSKLGLHINLRPVRAFPGVACLRPETDMVIVRENSECLYTGVEHEITPGVITATRVITEAASTRVAQFAFNYAKTRSRRKVTAIHKSNVLRKTDGLFLECCRATAAQYPELRYEEGLVDSAAMRMIMYPSDYDVVVTTNLFGDILSDLAAGLVGGLGLCPSANLGERRALFEPVHGTAPDIAGKGLANPAAAIMCGAMLLRRFGEHDAADRVESALFQCITEKLVTPDLGGGLSTMETAREVVRRM
jgi:3-isopropylmalate dehydrogenase